jgi:hypothetical protein
MPVLLLWAVPTVIVVGGLGYYFLRVVHEAEFTRGRKGPSRNADRVFLLRKDASRCQTRAL